MSNPSSLASFLQSIGRKAPTAAPKPERRRAILFLPEPGGRTRIIEGPYIETRSERKTSPLGWNNQTHMTVEVVAEYAEVVDGVIPTAAARQTMLDEIGAGQTLLSELEADYVMEKARQAVLDEIEEHR